MNGRSDQQLLREYAECRSEAAFAELVRRHVDLVYSAALRMVRDPHLAQDVSQAVFGVLAQSAPKLTDRPVLCGWLHRTTRNLASKTVRSDVVRRAREQEAAAMNELLSAEPDPLWEQVAPHLDAAVNELNESDRDALMLRYFQSRSAREIGQALGISEEAAQKRVNRAVERLRGYFAKRGVVAGAGGLVVALSANAVQAAPAGLAGAISSAVLAGSAFHATTALAATKALAMTTTQKAAVSILTAVALGAGFYLAHQVSTLRREILVLEKQQTAIRAEIRQAQREDEAARERLAAVDEENKRLKANQPVAEVLKERGEVARWRSAATDSEAATIKTSLEKVERLKQRLEQTPEAKIAELQLLTDKDWFNMAKGDLSSPEDYQRAFAGLRRSAQQTFAPLLQAAVRGYLYASQGRYPTNLAETVPFFKPPIDPAIVEGWQIVPGEQYGMGSDLTFTQRSAVDKGREMRVFLTAYGNRWEPWYVSESRKATP
jgi:RNA polymerase sigma factor (sigma-70 family)